MFIRRFFSSMFRTVELSVDVGYLTVDPTSVRSVVLPDGTTRITMRASCPSRWYRAVIRHRNDSVDLTQTFERLGDIQEDEAMLIPRMVMHEVDEPPAIPRRRLYARRRSAVQYTSPRTRRAIEEAMLDEDRRDGR